MTTILRFILLFLLAPAFAIVAQAAGAFQDNFCIVDAGVRAESAILESLDGGVLNYDSSGALLQQRSSLDGKSADEDTLGGFREFEASEAAQSHFAFFAELVAANKGVGWKNGWRTADGKFASPNGAGRSGAAAEQSVWDAVSQKPGWNVIEGNVGVRNASGQLRYYDGAAVSPRGRVIGLEVKSGSAVKTPAQRIFDSGVNTSNPAVGVGQNRGLEVGRSLQIRR